MLCSRLIQAVIIFVIFLLLVCIGYFVADMAWLSPYLAVFAQRFLSGYCFVGHKNTPSIVTGFINFS